MSGNKVIHLLRTSAMPIMQQLCLEESLLRVTNRNWLLLNDGTSEPAIVLGISGKPQKLVHLPEARASGIPMIKRYTGGGTVVVDSNTVFATMIFNTADVPDVQPFPCPIMKFTGQVYSDVFHVLLNGASYKRAQGEAATCGSGGKSFSVRENDYCWGDQKIAGNAQAIVKDRWLHHTSFLWDYRRDHMALLQEPERRPKYRGLREHTDFLIPLSRFGFRRRSFLESIEDAMISNGFEMKLVELQDVEILMQAQCLRSTRLISYQDVM
eukprot:jgi/Ulvmu1/7345/UM036_0005.1